MREAAAAVEQSRDGVREQRTAGHRAGDDLGVLHDVAGQQIDQILREAPDASTDAGTADAG